MTIYQLECFIAVAEELNFSAAAQRLFTTQPAVTYQINTLEKETGLHLFDRTTRRTKLTAAGQSFYLDMVQMTSFGRQALKKAQDIQAADRSHLVVGLRQLFDYGTFASILAEYQRQYPNAQVEVVPQSNRRPLEELRSGQLDIGFFYATEHSSDLYYGNGIVCSDQCSGKTSVEKVLNMAIEDCRLKLQTQAAVSLPT